MPCSRRPRHFQTLPRIATIVSSARKSLPANTIWKITGNGNIRMEISAANIARRWCPAYSRKPLTNHAICWPSSTAATSAKNSSRHVSIWLSYLAHQLPISDPHSSRNAKPWKPSPWEVQMFFVCRHFWFAGQIERSHADP